MDTMYQSIFTDELSMDAKVALPIIKSWGLEHVDFRGMINDKGIEFQTEAELRALKKQLDELGFTVAVLQSSLCKVHLPDKERQAQELEKLEGLIRASEILECKLVRSFFYWQPEEVDMDLYGQLTIRPDLMAEVTERFAPILKRAKEAGLIIGFENCGVTVDEVMAFLDIIDMPKWGLGWDPANGFGDIPNEKWADYIVKSLKRTVLVHVKAYSILPEILTVETPWERILRSIEAAHMDVPVSIETHNPEVSPLTDDKASKLSVDAIKRLWPFDVSVSLKEAAQEAAYPPCAFTDNPVKFVVVGLGMGHFRCNQIVRNPATKLLGVCDTNLEKAKEAGEEFGVKYSDDIHVFLSDPEVEVMYVITPTGTHCEVAEQCLKAGKHVLMTKPMDANSEACERVIRLAKECNLLLGVDFDMRHTTEMLELMEASRRGWFGRILSANTNLYVKRTQEYYDANGAWRGTWKYDGGGAMCNQGVHEVDRLYAILGMPKQVRGGIGRQAHFIETEDIGWSEWEYESGVVVRYASTTNYPIDAWHVRIEIHGTAGAYVYTEGGPEGQHAWWTDTDGEWKEEAPYPITRRWRSGSDNFANSVRTGEPLSIAGEVGVPSRAILDAIYKSAAKGGQWVELGTCECCE